VWYTPNNRRRVYLESGVVSPLFYCGIAKERKMKSDFVLAITQLAAEKNLPKEIVLKAVESALASAYRKDYFTINQPITVRLDPGSGRVRVWVEKKVVDIVEDARIEISIKDAHKIKSDVGLEDLVMVEDTPNNAGRIAAQTAKQVILQRLHEAENSAVIDEYANKEGDIVSGIIQRIEPRQVLIDLGRAEAVMPLSEQVRSERYRIGQRLKVYLVEVASTSKGPHLVLSRSHPHLLKRLFELEIPEVYNGIVEIKSVSREAGSRSKVAVAARQAGIDPVGCCVGLRGVRIQNIVSELNGEKIDVVAWNVDPAVYIANALSPAQVTQVSLDNENKLAVVVIPDRQLSLAIGKEGQNVRLAVKLTGWKIDIKSVSEFETERIEAKEDHPETEPPLEGVEPLFPDISSAETEKDEATFGQKTSEEEQGEAVPVAFFEEESKVKSESEKSQVRFAEDVMPARAPSAGGRDKKKKKKSGKDSAEDGVKIRKQRRGGKVDLYDTEEI
jgi:N utilization substance protein A